MRIVDFVEQNKQFFKKASLCQTQTGLLSLELILLDKKYETTVTILAEFFMICNDNIQEIRIQQCGPCSYSKLIEVLYACDSDDGDIDDKQ